jgi:hypothetical protein
MKLSENNIQEFLLAAEDYFSGKFAKLKNDAAGAADTLDTRVTTLEGVTPYKTLLTLAADIPYALNDFIDVTGLSFAVTAGTMYRFSALMIFDCAGTAHGAKWGINGPSTPTLLAYHISQGAPGGTEVNNYVDAYDGGSGATDVSTTSDNIARIEGLINPSSSGTVTLRVACEQNTQAITVLAGSTLEYW